MCLILFCLWLKETVRTSGAVSARTYDEFIFECDNYKSSRPACYNSCYAVLLDFKRGIRLKWNIIIVFNIVERLLNFVRFMFILLRVYSVRTCVGLFIHSNKLFYDLCV